MSLKGHDGVRGEKEASKGLMLQFDGQMPFSVSISSWRNKCVQEISAFKLGPLRKRARAVTAERPLLRALALDANKK